MHYYQWNIGDYAAHTRHLSLLEDLAYRRLLEACYLSEQPLPDDIKAIARLVGMRDNIDEVHEVLDEFFQHEDGVGYTHDRVDEEIEKTGRKRELARKAGRASAEKRAAVEQASDDQTTDVRPESNGRSTDAERTFNGDATDVQPPITHNPVPITQESASKPRRRAIARPDSVPKQSWEDWQAVRKAKRAGPITITVLARMQVQADKAKIPLAEAITIAASRGWQAFEADWLKSRFAKPEGASHAVPQTRHNAAYELGDDRCECLSCGAVRRDRRAS